MKTLPIGCTSTAKIYSLFSSTGAFQQDQVENLPNRAYQNGIDSYIGGDYDKVIMNFKRSISLSPYSVYSIETRQYIAKAYLKQSKVDDAINIYKQSIRLFPSDDSSHLNLGTVYYSNGRCKEAEEE
jgi:tetratricopeptide (TPR) repeat protein